MVVQRLVVPLGTNYKTGVQGWHLYIYYIHNNMEDYRKDDISKRIISELMQFISGNY